MIVFSTKRAFIEYKIDTISPYYNINRLNLRNLNYEPTLKSKACLKCLYFTIIIFDLCRYLEYFSYLYTINQTE